MDSGPKPCWTSLRPVGNTSVAAAKGDQTQNGEETAAVRWSLGHGLLRTLFRATDNGKRGRTEGPRVEGPTLPEPSRHKRKITRDGQKLRRSTKEQH